jgi:hypothetical protein
MLLVFGLASFVPPGTVARAATPDGDDTGTASALQISYQDTDVRVKYGLYTEATFTLSGNISGNVQWQVQDSSLPDGMEIQDTNGPTVMVFGTPKFTDQWCFVLNATDDAGDIAAQEVCYNSDEDTTLTYPRFNTASLLDNATQGVAYQETISLQDSTSARAESNVVSSNLPDTVSVSVQNDADQALVNGTFATVGMYRFVIRLKDSDGNVNAKQFQVFANEPGTGSGDGCDNSPPACPAGYYFDNTLNYCVQSTGNQCPDGTYYDVDQQVCVQFPAPPPAVVCDIGYHFDPYLSSCVQDGVPFCPLNYAWDSFYNRCVRQPYTCSWGYRYDWSVRECTYVWTTVCDPGTHYDAGRGGCVQDWSGCAFGFYWNPVVNACLINGRACGDNQYWDPALGGCVDRARYRNCAPGWNWNPRSQSCEFRYSRPS